MSMQLFEPAPTGPGERQVPLWSAPAAVLLGFFGAFFVTIVIQIAGSAFGSTVSKPTPAVNLIADFFFDFAFVGAAVYFAVLNKMSRADLGYLRIRWLTGIGAFVLAVVSYYVVTFVYQAIVSVNGTDKLPSELGVTHSTAAAIAATVFVCVVAPICEEFFFRGFLFGVLKQMRVPVAGRDLGPLIAALIVALLFGLAHTGSANPQFLIPLGFLGFVLCLVRWKTGSLYPCMALHSVNNSVALGVNELHWNAGVIVAVASGALLVIGAVTGPLSRPAVVAG
jgi:uncharacterized protein